MKMNKKSVRFLIIFSSALVISACASQPRLWLANSVVSAGLKSDGTGSERVTLQRPGQVSVVSINRATIQNLLEVHARIDEVAHISSSLYLTNRGQPYPNAYAATIDGKRIVAINFKMIELLAPFFSSHPSSKKRLQYVRESILKFKQK